ncbi:MAG: hypothetical protein ACK5LG_21890 [Bacteroides thetaiotaomicron]
MKDTTIYKPKKGPFAGICITPIYHRRLQIYPTKEDALMDISDCPMLEEGNFGALSTVVACDDVGEFLVLAFNGPQYMTPEVVSHEAVHLAWFALDLAGVEVTVDNHEQLAYLVGYYVNQINLVVEAYLNHVKKLKEDSDEKV